MIRVEYTLNSRKLESAYVKLFPYSDMQKQWRALQIKYATVFGTAKFPTVLQLLKAPIETLVETFFLFTEKIDAAKTAGIIDKDSKKTLIDELFAIFNYDRKGGYRDKIAAFMMEESNMFKIHTCHYCDMAYVNYFKTSSGKKVRQFDVEHILDKGKCPLVALSLYNFLPSCQPCNRTIKGSYCAGETKSSSRTGRLKDIIKKLSPTNPNYDFDGNMSFYIKPIDPLNTSFENLLAHEEDFELDIHTDGDADYQFEVEQFHLKERYNCHRSEAFFLKDKLDHYPKSKIEEIARLAKTTPENVANDLFGIDFHMEHHRTFSKLYRDIFRYYNKM
jgi:hypothetical protein